MGHKMMGARRGSPLAAKEPLGDFATYWQKRKPNLPQKKKDERTKLPKNCRSIHAKAARLRKTRTPPPGGTEKGAQTQV